MAPQRARGHNAGRRGAVFMVESFPVAVISGCVFGFLSGLGVGGGSLLMLWITLIVGMAPQTARAVNLLFFLPAALISCLFRLKQGHLPLKKLLVPCILGSAAAGVFSLWGTKMDTDSLKMLFGILLVVTGIRELCYRERKLR